MDASPTTGAPWASTPLSQVGGYELDLLKLGYFGWMNVASIATEFWLQQLLVTMPTNDEN